MRSIIATLVGGMLAASIGVTFAPGAAGAHYRWIGEGMYDVGGQIAPGVYKAPRWAKRQNTYCITAVRTSPRAGHENIIENNVVVGKDTQFVTVQQGQWLEIRGNLGCRFFRLHTH